uniref:G-protein coupled receptors family 1 profile domain-containing protein n=1 Tax=Onchocerca volvulus TaxID=6282 RepID=A0A8R1XNX6_ONCVO
MNMSMYEDIDSITKIPSFIRTYIYAITGLLLSGINTPLFITIITDRNFRTYYRILSFVFVNGGITGLLMISYAILIFTKPNLQFATISNKKCIFQISTGLLQMKVLNAFGLLAHSIDRLLVVCYPIYYFRNIRKLNAILLTGWHILSFATAFLSIILTLLRPTRMIKRNCPQQSTLHPTALIIAQFLTSASASMSIMVMSCVVYCLKRRYNEIVKNATNAKRDLQNFLKKQKQFTLTALISCIITLCKVFFIAEFQFSKSFYYFKKKFLISTNLILLI